MGKGKTAPIAATLLVGALLAACGQSTDPTTTTTPVPTTATAPGSPTTTEATPTTTAASPATTTTLVPATVVSTTTLQGAAIEIVVANGEVKGPGRVKVAVGAMITLIVTADVADEVHLHGYDIFAEVAPNQAAIIELEASIPGIFEVELEGAGLELVLIEVS